MRVMSGYFGKNLKFLREKKGLDQLELAGLLGRKSASSVSEWEKGTYTPKSGVLSDIAKIFNVNLQSLMSEDLTSVPNNIKEIDYQTVRIPVLGKIACGDPIMVMENYEDYRTALVDGLPAGKLVYLQAKGDSMAPTIPDGAMVLIREQPDVENGEIAAVLINGNEEATLKRCKKQGNMIVLMPDNPAHEPIFVTKENPIKIIGKAMRFEQEL